MSFKHTAAFGLESVGDSGTWVIRAHDNHYVALEPVKSALKNLFSSLSLSNHCSKYNMTKEMSHALRLMFKLYLNDLVAKCEPAVMKISRNIDSVSSITREEGEHLLLGTRRDHVT